LHFIDNQKNPMLVTNPRSSFIKPAGEGHNRPALDRFDHNRGNSSGGVVVLKSRFSIQLIAPCTTPLSPQSSALNGCDTRSIRHVHDVEHLTLEAGRCAALKKSATTIPVCGRGTAEERDELSRPVACIASFKAVSTASVPLFAKCGVGLCTGTISSSFIANSGMDA
jgi:hypothetical protein